MPSARPFNGDYDQLANLMKLSWAENKKEPLEYTVPFLRSALQQPGADPAFFVSLYEGDDLIGFGAGLHRTIRMASGAVCRVLLDSFITVAPAFKGKGLGRQIWTGLAKAACDGGLDGLITFSVEGDGMNANIPRYAADANLPTAKSLLVRYLARPVRRSPDATLQFADAAVLQRPISRALPFERLWSEPEALWQCRLREGAFGCTLTHDSSTGIISAYKMRTAGAQPITCGLVDFIVWDKLALDAQTEMVKLLMSSAAAAEVDLLLVPVLNYTSLEPFTRAGFRMTARALQMYLTSFSPRFEVENITSACIDVF